jgi:hypothetical protein
MTLYKMIPRDHISKEGLASDCASYSIDAYNGDIMFFIVVTDPLSGLKDVPKSVITNIS